MNTTITSLEQLLKLNGVVAAGEFTADGKLVDFQTKMNMPQDIAEMTAQFCASVTMMFNSLAGSYSRISGMSWTPQQGWAYSGGEWTVAVGGNRGVFVRTAEADFNQLSRLLFEVDRRTMMRKATTSFTLAGSLRRLSLKT